MTNKTDGNNGQIGRVLMVQGTMSSVGKSLLVAALCRIFSQDGWRVAPFKSQNMALNSFATCDGGEVGRAQAMQAAAAGIDVTVDMNPVLIKPEADSFSQVIVRGQPWARLAARDYYRRRHELWGVVTDALDSLRRRYEVVIIEGAGSPVELNLKRGDMVNMAVATYADAPVLLVGDIACGGIFAQLLGTLQLLDAAERSRVCGLIVNKFRGDSRLFDDGVRILHERSTIPVLGVVPYIHDVGIADEDSAVFDERVASSHPSPASADTLDIVVVRVPHMSNFDDFDALSAEPSVRVRFVEHPSALGTPDMLILPGTKTTVSDLQWLHERGMATAIMALSAAGTALFGVCGGYQMLGRYIADPFGVESASPTTVGLSILPLVTTFAATKKTVQVRGHIVAHGGLFAGTRGMACGGYEIHMGTTESDSTQNVMPLLTHNDNTFDGAVATNGWVAGTYLHGFFDNDALRHALLHNLAIHRNKICPTTHARFDRNAAYDRLAAIVREHLDIAYINRILHTQEEKSSCNNV